MSIFVTQSLFRTIKNNKPYITLNFTYLTFVISMAISLISTGTAQSQTGFRGNLTGRVLDDNGHPLNGANILLEPDLHSINTNASGSFQLKNIIAGRYTAYISKISYQSDTTIIIIEADKTATLDIHLKKKENTIDQVEVQGKVTAVDNLLDIQRSAMPVTVIGKEMIAQMGSRRLDEVLKEQTGITMVNDIGSGSRAIGIQMQGFSSEYVMILIDGQPMVGRNNGNFDLSRISVSNIERIEIIKGASSCLFGSEALGGAINIVTRHGALQPQALASLRYGSLNIVDATLEGETPFHHQRGSANLSANYYRSDGFNVDPYMASGTTVPPFDEYALQGRARYRLTETGTLGASARYSLRRSEQQQGFASGGSLNTLLDNQDLTDINASLTYDKSFTNGLRSMSRYYLTRYLSDMQVAIKETGVLLSLEKFEQTLHRFEQQFAYAPYRHLKLTGGLGGSAEAMDNNNYEVPGMLWSGFAYLQTDWKISNRLEAVGGLRYDHHNSFGARANPSLGLQYHILPTLTLKAALGSGFKTPDYRQRFQIFRNPTQNYLVIGTERLHETLEQMKEDGEISEMREYLVNQLDKNLQAERSLSFNGGFIWRASSNLKVEANAFYHDIHNQINNIRVAIGTNVRDIYTYQNLPRSYNTGIDASIAYSPVKDLEISAGYQYLVSKDKGIMDSIRNGTGNYAFVRNNATGEDRASALSDYFGLENRSRHMANFRVFYRYSPWDISANIRVNYRGKYAFGDANNNQFIDPYDTFVHGYFLVNAVLEKKLIKQRLSIQLTADNIMDYTDRLILGQPGRVLLLGLSYRFYR
ncbi:TonB-dependent receptor [Sphingobacterium sp. LRF_L2]|uniref:TonB-dependent receptor n=1 Tax=Sphingobacterium sp. LRF_L2 TaxID=3369421 RepID=UPI003F5E593E